jgi:hypothetical protein
MIRFLLAVALSCLPIAARAASMPPIWEGQMTQYDGQGTTNYPVRLVRLGDSISSEYPTLKCRGTWTLIATKADYNGWKEAHLGWFASFEGQPTSAWAVVKPAAR